MHLVRIIIAAAFLLAGSFVWAAAEVVPASHGAGAAAVAAKAQEPHGAAAAHGAEHTNHELPRNAVKPHEKFPITNSMIVTWVVALLLIVAAQAATRNVKLIPEGAQNFWEWLVESLHGLLEGIIGPDLVKKTFWFFATIFIFILATNWIGLVPGVGTIGWGVPAASSSLPFSLEEVTNPLFRGGNADLNMTAAMSMIFFACWTVWAFQANGLKGFILHLFGPKGDSTGVLKLLMIVVFIFVGVLEVISIAFRPISLSFRLFGNIFAGENMLETMSHLSGPVWGAIIPIPFYFLELLVGLVQALVFMLLTAVFTMLICAHDEDHASPDHH